MHPALTPPETSVAHLVMVAGGCGNKVGNRSAFADTPLHPDPLT